MTVMISGILYASVFLSSLVAFEEVSAFTFCEASVYTIKYVKECPTNAEEWNIATRRKNCESIQHNCSVGIASNTQQYVFQYHCVINVWRNATLEVCALNRTILGHCAEFNKMGAVVQDNYHTDCTRLEPPCPTSYNSAEAYKYQTCYNIVRNIQTQRNYSTERYISCSKRFTGSLLIICQSFIFEILILLLILKIQ